MAKKLVLFFDINSTILADDKSSSMTLEDALNIHLASTVWTKEGGPARFNLRLFEGPTCSSSSSVASGYKYYKRVMPADHKPYLMKFSSTSEGAEYAYFYGLLLRALQSKPPMSIFDSFFAMLGWLRDCEKERGWEWCAVLRTYGDDLPFLLQEVRNFANGAFPVADTYATLSFAEKSGCDNDVVCLRVDDTTTLTCENDVVKWIYAKKGVIGVQDDYFYWKRKGFGTEYGKPLWVPFSTSTQYVPIFFDDNFRFGSDNSILDVRVQHSQGGPYTSVFKNGAFTEPVADAKSVTERTCVKARMFEAITNKNYFINHIKQRIGSVSSPHVIVRAPNPRELSWALERCYGGGGGGGGVSKHLEFLMSQFAHKTEFVDWILTENPWVHAGDSPVLGFCQTYRRVVHSRGATRHAYGVRNLRVFDSAVSASLLVKALAEKIGAVDPFAEYFFCESPSLPLSAALLEAGFVDDASVPAKTLTPKTAAQHSEKFARIGPLNFEDELRKAACHSSSDSGAPWPVAEDFCAQHSVGGVCYNGSSWAFWSLVEDCCLWVFLLAGNKERFPLLTETARAHAARCGAKKVVVAPVVGRFLKCAIGRVDSIKQSK